MRQGIEAREFCCFFQPQVTLQGAVFRGVEALVRWRHGRFGLLGPAAFLPQAERHEGLMSDLTMAVLEDVAECRRDWKRRGLEIDVSVNLSAASLEVPVFSDRVLEVTQRLELPPKALVFEVTESASTTRLGPFLANLAKLRMKGFRLSIDDFGTGFATFEQLERIPFTELKIDRSITYLLPQEARQLHMARRLIQMAKDLKLAVVAEGIETLENWQALRKLGCELGQGYFIARPMPGDQIAGWARQSRSFLRG
ncbi:MAG TPA: EAL domain-containing protein [Holophaga sp.]|nr:EAL domain-containing protein [Holophaga sp.]